MATPILNKLSKDLSFKIFDPVTDGKDDGRVYTKELRLSYINRAYGKLVRTLEVIHPKITKVFKDYYQVIQLGDLDLTSDGLTVPAGKGNAKILLFPWEVFDVYYKPNNQDGTGLERADALDPDNFLPTKLGLNDLYVATLDNRKWSMIDNQIQLLPLEGGAEYYDVTIFVRNYFPEFNQDDTNSADLDIPNDYKDILITMAAIEAMSDRGLSGKYQLYTATLNSQLQLIAQDKVNADIEEKGQK
jgi:hypothetical protein